MQRKFLLFTLVNYLYLVSATENVPEIEYNEQQISIISVSESEIKISLNSDALTIDDETIQTLRDIVNKKVQSRDDVFNINESADNIISSVSREILRNSDPIPLSNRDIVFEYRPIIITHTGTLALTTGQLQELSAISRRGDATLTYSYPPGILRVLISLNFGPLITRYNFRMNVRGDTAEGVLHAWLFDTTAAYTLDVELGETLSVISSEFILKPGPLQINLFGSGLSNSYRSLITDLTRDLIRDTVIQYSNSIVGGLLKDAVSSSVGAN